MKRRTALKVMAAAFLPGLSLPEGVPDVYHDPSLHVPVWPEGDGVEYDFWSPLIVDGDPQSFFSYSPRSWKEAWDEALELPAQEGLLGDIGGDE
jgi:hypothetical protein